MGSRAPSGRVDRFPFLSALHSYGALLHKPHFAASSSPLRMRQLSVGIRRILLCDESRPSSLGNRTDTRKHSKRSFPARREPPTRPPHSRDTMALFHLAERRIGVFPDSHPPRNSAAVPQRLSPRRVRPRRRPHLAASQRMARERIGALQNRRRRDRIPGIGQARAVAPDLLRHDAVSRVGQGQREACRRQRRENEPGERPLSDHVQARRPARTRARRTHPQKTRLSLDARSHGLARFSQRRRRA